MKNSPRRHTLRQSRAPTIAAYNSSGSGTGSNPPFTKGLHRPSRFSASHAPRRAPCFCTASCAYREHVGWYLHIPPKKGERKIWYTRIRNSSTHAPAERARPAAPEPAGLALVPVPTLFATFAAPLMFPRARCSSQLSASQQHLQPAPLPVEPASPAPPRAPQTSPLPRSHEDESPRPTPRPSHAGACVQSHANAGGFDCVRPHCPAPS
jgi:hypothetical protein